MLEQGIVQPFFGPEPVSDPAEARRHGKKHDRGREVEMLAWVLLVANMPTIVCTLCSAFLAYLMRNGRNGFGSQDCRCSPASAAC
jgi:hypothetical protein